MTIAGLPLIVGVGLVTWVPAWAEMSHGGAESDSAAGRAEAVVIPGGGSSAALRQGAPPAGAGSEEKAATTAASSSRGDRTTGPSQTVILFAAGPLSPGNPPSPRSIELQQTLVRAVRERSPQAIVIVLPVLSLEALERVPSSRTGAVAGSVLTVTAVLQGAFDAAEPARVLTTEGWIEEVALGRALAKLAKGLGVPCFGRACADDPARAEPPPLGFPRAALHTVLLSSHAGAVLCERFPGPVFGLTASDEERDANLIDAWISREGGRRPEPFPVTAREWFDSWGTTHARRQGWYCPHPGPAGYAGAKVPYVDTRGPARAGE